MSKFDKMVPGALRSIDRQIATEFVKKNLIQRKIWGQDNCDCDCDACDSCEYKDSGLDDAELEKLQKKVEDCEAEILRLRDESRRLTDYAKRRNINLEEKK